jgi:hypothetical protein
MATGGSSATENSRNGDWQARMPFLLRNPLLINDPGRRPEPSCESIDPPLVAKGLGTEPGLLGTGRLIPL